MTANEEGWPVDVPNIHQRGADRFGTLWLAVNVHIVDICKGHGIEVWSEPWRTVLPLIAFEWCDDIRQAEERAKQQAQPQHACDCVKFQALDK